VTKKIPSKEEVQNRRAEDEAPKNFTDQVRATSKKAAELRKWAASPVEI
jgi:hypothetical protein